MVVTFPLTVQRYIKSLRKTNYLTKKRDRNHSTPLYFFILKNAPNPFEV